MTGDDHKAVGLSSLNEAPAAGSPPSKYRLFTLIARGVSNRGGKEGPWPRQIKPGEQQRPPSELP